MQLVCNLLAFRICQAMSIALESILKSWTTGCLVWTKFLFNCSCHRVASRHQAEVTRDPQDVCCIIEASHDQFYPEKCQWQPPKCYAMILVTMDMFDNEHAQFLSNGFAKKACFFFKPSPPKWVRQIRVRNWCDHVLAMSPFLSRFVSFLTSCILYTAYQLCWHGVWFTFKHVQCSTQAPTIATTKAAPQMAQKTAADRKAADSMAKRQGERSEQRTLSGSDKYPMSSLEIWRMNMCVWFPKISTEDHSTVIKLWGSPEWKTSGFWQWPNNTQYIRAVSFTWY